MKQPEPVLAYAKLILNSQIQAIDLDACYSEGHDACGHHQQEEDANPYPHNSKAHQYWQDGWWASFYGEPATLELAVASARLEDQPAPQQVRAFDYRNLIARSLQFGTVAMLAAIGMEIADIALANFGFYESVAML